MSELNYRIVAGGPEHGKAMVTLLPLLASFEIPARRAPEHLWHGDRDMIEEWLAGEIDRGQFADFLDVPPDAPFKPDPAVAAGP